MLAESSIRALAEQGLPSDRTEPESNRQWEIPYGSEFWRAQDQGKAFENSGTQRLPFHLGDVIDRVVHAIRRDERGRGGEVRADRYRARLDEEGIVFMPLGAQRSGRGAEADLPGAVFRTAELRRGTEVLVTRAQAAADWQIQGNVAQRSHGPGVIEHVQAGGQGVEITWILRSPPAGEGPLQIELDVGHADYSGKVGQAHCFNSGPDAPEIRVGEAVLVDSAGIRSSVLSEYADGVLRFTVPEPLLAQAVYPIAIDPLISPDFAMGDPVEGPAFFGQGSPAIASNGSGYLVCWNDARNLFTSRSDIYGTRISQAGEILDPEGLLIARGEDSELVPSAASNGEDYLVVWQSRIRGIANEQEIGAVRISSREGVVDESRSVIRSFEAGGVTAAFPAVSSAGTDYLVIWVEPVTLEAVRADIMAARVSGLGELIDSTPIQIARIASNNFVPRIASNQEGYFVVWEEFREESRVDVLGRMLSNDGNPVGAESMEISTAPRHQSNPDVASNGTDYLVVWSDSRAGLTNQFGGLMPGLRGTRVSREGILLDPDSFDIEPSGRDLMSPRVASSGRGYFVVWAARTGRLDDYNLYGVQLNREGAVIEGSRQVVSDAADHQWFPAVASNSEHYFVAWMDQRVEFLGDLFGTMVSADGTISDPDGLLLARGENDQWQPAVASNGEQFLVVWTDSRNGFTVSDIFGTRVSREGDIMDREGIPIGMAPGRQRAPSVAGHKTGFFVVWEDSRKGPGDADIRGARITGDGRVLDSEGLLISGANDDQTRPDVACSGDACLVVWEDARKNQAFEFAGGIFGARLGIELGTLDPDGIPISSGRGRSLPAVASGDGGYLVAWTDESDRTTGWNIRAIHVGANGIVLNRDPMTLVRAPGHQTFCDVASNGAEYLVVWEDWADGSISGTLVGATAAGDPQSATDSFRISSGTVRQRFPRAASDGRDYLVVWNEITGRLEGIAGARIFTGVPELVVEDFSISPPKPRRGTAAGGGDSDGFLLGYVELGNIGVRRLRGRMVEFEPLSWLRVRKVDEEVEIAFRAASPADWVIETSSELSNWITIGRITNGTERVIRIRPGAGEFEGRFYRARLR